MYRSKVYFPIIIAYTSRQTPESSERMVSPTTKIHQKPKLQEQQKTKTNNTNLCLHIQIYIHCTLKHPSDGKETSLVPSFVTEFPTFV